MQDTRDLNIAFGYRQLSRIIEELHYAQQPSMPWHRDIKHKEPVEEEVGGEEGQDGGVREFQPWYP